MSNTRDLPRVHLLMSIHFNGWIPDLGVYFKETTINVSMSSFPYLYVGIVLSFQVFISHVLWTTLVVDGCVPFG